MNQIHVTIPPPKQKSDLISCMSIFTPAYQQCLDDNPTGMGSLNAFEHCDIAVDGPRVTRPNVPLGQGTFPVFGPGYGLPIIYASPGPAPQAGISQPTDRRDQPPNQEGVHVNGEGQLVILGPGAAPNTTRVMKGKITYTVPTDMLDLIRMRPFTKGEVPTSSGRGPGTPAYVPVIIDQEEPMSLIDAVVDLGTAYFASQQPAYNPTMGLAAPGGTVVVGGALPAQTPSYESICPTGSGNKGMIWDPNANCGAGKWIKRRKRRRQRLATASDIKDIGALKSVLGPKALGAWIATH